MHIRVVDRAIEIHGGMALTDDTPSPDFSPTRAQCA